VKPHKILLIDDDTDMLRLLSRHLGRDGLELVHAQDGVTALTVALREQPDAIILDIGLPGGGGLEVLSRLQSNVRLLNVPVLVLTAKGRAMEERSLQGGASAFLAKPAEAADVLEALHAILPAA